MYIILHIHIYQCGKDVNKLHQLAAPQASVCEAGHVQDKGSVCCNLFYIYYYYLFFFF